ncbi:lysosome membrane protein 2 [Hyalella azteca]|uniref:Lysosome membrane protein 2 n=1 Tax=Hyalella azteca TaxID=294128 RepID=A0A8B7NFQ2_HYAAZ|nr:lysosome membrane protein 2 [Hyalella azteca]
MKLWIQFVVCAVGFLFLVFGFVLIQKFPAVVQRKLGEKLVIRPDSPTIGNFIETPIPVYMQFYFFNVTNPQEILTGSRPALQEIGPFTYLEKRLKHDLNWTDTTVEYLENTKFFFQPEMSNGLTEETPITTVNPVLISVASKATGKNSFIDGIIEFFRQRFELNVFITKTAGELLFHGYEEDFLLEIYKFTNNPQYRTGRFGFFYPKNDSDGGKYSIFTGADGLDQLQVIDEYEDSKTLDYWSDPYCNMINGTTGGQFPQPINPGINITMFSGDLCRSLYLTYEKSINHGGLELLRYSLPNEVLADRPENQCYCTDNFTCKASLVNLAPCRAGSPVIASTPHFYMGDSELVSAVDGLHPSKEEHETFLDIEPNTGVSFRAVKRIQISMPLKPYANLPILSNVTPAIFPLLWLDENALVPEDRARKLHEQLSNPIKISQWISYALFALGGVFVIAPLIAVVESKHRRKNNKSSVEKERRENSEEGESFDPLSSRTDHNLDDPEKE